jgi:hypothetical protein
LLIGLVADKGNLQSQLGGTPLPTPCSRLREV